MSAAGNHTFVAPAGLSTSARVVTSKLRQLSDGGCCANKSSAFDRVRPAHATLVDHKKSRRFIQYPHETCRLVVSGTVGTAHPDLRPRTIHRAANRRG